METTYIQTEDGETKVEWWPEEKFRNRATEIFTPSSYDRIPVPDNLIICDFCNEDIVEFPVPVLWGTHAVCPKCLERVSKK